MARMGTGRRSSVFVPPLFYLETSAVRHLVEDPARASLRQRIESLVAQNRLLLCTSYVMVEELITSTRTVAARRTAIAFARDLTPRRLLGSFEAVVRRWVVDGPNCTKYERDFVDWRCIARKLDEVVAKPPPHLMVGRDALRARAKKFRDDIASRLRSDGYPGKRKRSRRHWELPQNLFAEVRWLTRQLFRSPDRYVALWRPLVNDPNAPVSAAQAWESRKNPWVQLYTRLGLLGVARQLLLGTSDARLVNDYYDSIHVVCTSVADGLVTDDADLEQAIWHLRSRGIPKVWSLADWPSETERVC
jgi:hypothetical protein